MLVDAVAVPSIKCKQWTLSMNNSNAWHDTYVTGNAHRKCRSMFLDEISYLLRKCNWPKLFFFLSLRKKFFFFNYRFLFSKSLAYFHFANCRCVLCDGNGNMLMICKIEIWRKWGRGSLIRERTIIKAWALTRRNTVIVNWYFAKPVSQCSGSYSLSVWHSTFYRHRRISLTAWKLGERQPWAWLAEAETNGLARV